MTPKFSPFQQHEIPSVKPRKARHACKTIDNLSVVFVKPLKLWRGITHNLSRGLSHLLISVSTAL
jgi:hypothetical protein